MSEQWNADERDDCCGADRVEQELVVELQRLLPEGVDENGEQVERRLLWKSDESTEEDLSPVLLENLPDWCFLDLLLLDDRPEHRRLQDPEANVEADGDEDDAEQERDSPAPALECRAGCRNREGCYEGRGQQAHRNAKLGPAGEETFALLAPPFHGHEHRATPLTAYPDALADPQHDQDHGGPEADRGVGGHDADEKGRDTHEQKSCDQGRLPAEAVAVGAEQPGPDRARGKTNEKDRVVVERAGQRVGLGEEKLREDERCHRPEQEVVVPLDRRADGAGDHRPHHLFSALLRRVRTAVGGNRIRHTITPAKTSREAKRPLSFTTFYPGLDARIGGTNVTVEGCLGRGAAERTRQEGSKLRPSCDPPVRWCCGRSSPPG